MREWRNPAYRREWMVYIVVTVVLALAGAVGVSPLCGGLVLLCGALLSLAHAVFTRRRYIDIAALSHQMDAVLHGWGKLRIDENDEGELAILRSEAQKMTLRLRENADALLGEKKALTRVMEDIFHQLRTPLTAMGLEATLLGAEELPYERRLALTRELKKQLRHVNWLVETLLKMSQLDAGTVALRQESVGVAELVEKAGQSLAIPMELRGQTLRVDAGTARFTGDLSWSAEALGNILKNCMEHTPSGGAIFVKAEETPLFTQITVRDTGPGFDPADIPHLFERFYRGAGAGEGSIGIGLAMSRMVIAAQNGTVSADNPADGGARFTIRFYKSVV